MGSDSGTSPDDGEAPRENGEEAMPDADPLTCVVCGTTIDRSDWHPVRSWIDDDGQFRIDAYCSMACRAAHSPE